jgi:hypothetical protein
MWRQSQEASPSHAPWPTSTSASASWKSSPYSLWWQYIHQRSFLFITIWRIVRTIFPRSAPTSRSYAFDCPLSWRPRRLWYIDLVVLFWTMLFPRSYCFLSPWHGRANALKSEMLGELRKQCEASNFSFTDIKFTWPRCGYFPTWTK